MKQVLIKNISRKIEDNKQTIVNEYIEKELINHDEMGELHLQFDDQESAYGSYGISFDYDDEICLINLARLKNGLESFLEDEDTDEYLELRSILKKITPYEKYLLDFVEEIEEAKP